MKKPIIISLSILSIFILCNLSYQPIVADIYGKDIDNSTNVNFYYVNSYHYIEKHYRGSSGGEHIGYDVSNLHIDAEIDELFLDVVLNYSAEMNYSPILRLRDYVTPMLVCGIMVENYTDYKWEINKMSNFGYDYIEGNITVEIQIDMDNIKSGDIIKLKNIFRFISAKSFEIFRFHNTRWRYRILGTIITNPLSYTNIWYEFVI